MKIKGIASAVLAFAMAAGLSGCGRGKQNAALALDEARLNIAAARSAGAQKYAAEPLGYAETSLKEADKAFARKAFDLAKTEAQKAVQFAAAAQAEAEMMAAEKKKRTVKKAAAPKKAAQTVKKGK